MLLYCAVMLKLRSSRCCFVTRERLAKTGAPGTLESGLGQPQRLGCAGGKMMMSMELTYSAKCCFRVVVNSGL